MRKVQKWKRSESNSQAAQDQVQVAGKYGFELWYPCSSDLIGGGFLVLFNQRLHTNPER